TASDESLIPHEEEKAIMRAKKSEIRSKANPLVGGVIGESCALLAAHERPAIKIIQRSGNHETITEFAKVSDYAEWIHLVNKPGAGSL
ncbi:MAG: hypothetical protein ACRCT2_00060, partial [Plesiomonas shigelloides]